MNRKRRYNWKEEILMKEQEAKKFKSSIPSNSEPVGPPEIWFDDVDEILVESTRNSNVQNSKKINKVNITLNKTRNSKTSYNKINHQKKTPKVNSSNTSKITEISKKPQTNNSNRTIKKSNAVNTEQPSMNVNNSTQKTQLKLKTTAPLSQNNLKTNALKTNTTLKHSAKFNKGNNNKVTKVLGMDCEMVGVGMGGSDSMLARVSIVNQYGQCVYDKYVLPREKVTDYRTKVSGIRPCHLEKGEKFKVVQKEVFDMLKNKILVGHAIDHDLKVLFLDHPRRMIRDTSKFKPFRLVTGGGTPSLKKLSEKLLGVQIQTGEHDSIQDAQAAMRLYTLHRKRWETSLREKKFVKKKKEEKKKTS